MTSFFRPRLLKWPLFWSIRREPWLTACLCLERSVLLMVHLRTEASVRFKNFTYGLLFKDRSLWNWLKNNWMKPETTWNQLSYCPDLFPYITRSDCMILVFCMGPAASGRGICDINRTLLLWQCYRAHWIKIHYFIMNNSVSVLYQPWIDYWYLMCEYPRQNDEL